MSTRGQHLVSHPGLQDPNFAFTVVFMIEHSDEGALGVVLTRPSELTSTPLFADWSDQVPPPTKVFRGGPVAVSSVIALAVSANAHPDPLGPFNAITEHIGTFDVDAPRTETPGLVGLRLFAGYASWAPGQLEAELVDDAWFVVASSPSDILSPAPEELWWQVLARQTGNLRTLRHYPPEPWRN
jgi:putative transcriptional regulator